MQEKYKLSIVIGIFLFFIVLCFFNIQGVSAVNSSTNTSFYINATDDIPPEQIKFLTVIDKSYNWILWMWDNPDDFDFYQNIVYLDGEEIARTSSNFFNATGLKEDTKYTITLYTMDFSENVNYEGVSNTASTDERKEHRKKPRKIPEHLIDFNPYEFEAAASAEIVNISILTLEPEIKEKRDLSFFLFLILSLAGILVLILIILFVYLFKR
jgi:hypothetical protein